jgi:DNA gyrase/topoisomerase IV subunit B
MLAGIEAVLAPRLRARGLRKRLARGLAAAVHVILDGPKFPSQARRTITNDEVAPIVRALVERELARHLDATPALLDTILLDVS